MGYSTNSAGINGGRIPGLWRGSVLHLALFQLGLTLELKVKVEVEGEVERDKDSRPVQ